MPQSSMAFHNVDVRVCIQNWPKMQILLRPFLGPRFRQKSLKWGASFVDVRIHLQFQAGLLH